MASSLYPIQAHKLARRTKDKVSLRAHGSQDCFKNVFLFKHHFLGLTGHLLEFLRLCWLPFWYP